jgi:IS5 family transposase
MQEHSQIPCKTKVKHAFRILKHVFGFIPVRYRGIRISLQWLCATFALVNLYQRRNRLTRKNRSIYWGRMMPSQR